MALRENREARPWLRRNQGMARAGYLTVLLGPTAQARSSCKARNHRPLIVLASFVTNPGEQGISTICDFGEH